MGNKKAINKNNRYVEADGYDGGTRADVFGLAIMCNPDYGKKRSLMWFSNVPVVSRQSRSECRLEDFVICDLVIDMW
jgi:hypothetical protein